MYRSRSTLFWSLTFLLSVGLAGCSGTESKPEAANGGKPPEATTANKPIGKVTPADVPADVKHEAFEYYGLDNTAPVELRMTRGKDKLTGTRINRFMEVKDGNAIYEVEHTGGLSG